MKTFTFTVSGSGPFPTDMLRYDTCWPASSEDAEKLLTRGRRSVTLRSSSEVGKPTTGRWQSFGWWVTSDQNGQPRITLGRR